MRIFLLLIILSASPDTRASSRIFIDDPERLMKLEEKGFDFSRWVLQEPHSKKTNDKLTGNSYYKSFLNTLESDLDGAKRKDPMLSVTMSSGHRLFDQRWLKSPYAGYELVGVINRIDRIPFEPSRCGEIRFIYR